MYNINISETLRRALEEEVRKREEEELRKGVKSWYVYEVMIPAVMLGLCGVALYLYSLLM